MIKQYKQKPIVIEATQWNGNTNRNEIIQFVDKELRTKEFATAAYEVGQGRPCYSLEIETPMGIMEAIPSDWIVKGIDEKFYVCKNETFQKIYNEVIK